MSTRPIFLSKSDYAYTELKRLIVRRELAPGAKLDLDELARELGISRMPLRGALTRLQSQGLIEIHPQRSTQVAPLSIGDMVETYDARHALEGLMAERAAGKATRDDVRALETEIDRQAELTEANDLDGFLASDRAFHFRLFEIAQAPRILELLEGLRNVADRYIYLYLTDAASRATSIDEHREIVRLCGARDPAALPAAVRAHVAGGKRRLLQLLPSLEPKPPAPA
jgi:DNA-binding GntR family transcriptional regulator